MSSHVTYPKPPSILLDTLFQADASPDHVTLFDPHAEHPTVSPRIDDETRPWVTLTFAQSLDAKIAGEKGKQLILSGKESMVMTHWMRSMHDAILVGIGTALNDNPQLNTRHIPSLPSGTSWRYNTPRPVILDTHLRLRVDCKLLANCKSSVGRRPWVVGSHPPDGDEFRAWSERKSALESAGARVVDVDSTQNGISIPSLLSALRSLGIRSLMVEGGASIIKSFLRSTQYTEERKPVDAIIVTVSPTFVGHEGVGYGDNLLASQIPKMGHVRTEVFGADAVLALRLA